jgi:hypothetical protein
VAESLIVAAIYWPTRRLAFASDAWVYLGALRQGLWTAVGTPIGYHWQPVACLWVAAIRAVFGEHPAAFQAVNLVQLVLLGHLTFQLGQRLLADKLAAFLASLLVLGSAAFYEATYWPLAGNIHLLGALLYILALILAYDWASGGLPRGGGRLLGLTLVAAVLSHPAMVTSIAACALVLLVVGCRSDQRRREVSLAERLKPLLPLVVAAVVFVLSRLRPNPFAHLAPPPRLDSMRLLQLVRHGLIAIWTGRGSFDFTDRVTALGTQAPLPSAQVWTLVGAWLAAAAIVAAVLLWRVRSKGVRLLAAFLGIHLAALTIAGGISARQDVVPSVFAALLSAWALREAAQHLATRAKGAAEAALRGAIPVACVSLLIVAAHGDHRTAARVHLRVADASRLLIATLKDAVPEGQRTDVTLINLPAYMTDDGITAFAFANGLMELTHLATSADTVLSWGFIPVRSAPASVIPSMQLLSRTVLREQLADPRRVVLLYEDEAPSIRRLTLADMETLRGR